MSVHALDLIHTPDRVRDGRQFTVSVVHHDYSVRMFAQPPLIYNEIIAADGDTTIVAPFHRFLKPAEDDARSAV